MDGSKRDEPKAVVVTVRVHNKLYLCPVCSETLSTSVQPRIRYCQCCGQRIKFEEEK